MDRHAGFRKKMLKKGVHSSVCSLCNQNRFTEFTLRMHLRKEHNYKFCKFCSGIFDSETSLTEHLCPLRNIKCELCSKTFKTVSGWNSHFVKVHEGVGVVCDICGKEFSFVNNLRRHKKYRHPLSVGEVGAIPCHTCGKLSKNRESAREHFRRIHTTKHRSDPCKFCKRVFYSNWSLKLHTRNVHRDENIKQEGPKKEQSEKELN